MSHHKGYQLHFSRGDTVLKDIQGRTQKFRKILSVLQDFHADTQLLNCLDLGCSNGIITSLLGRHFKMAIGIDIDQEAVRYGNDHFPSPQVYFLVGDSMALPFRDNSIDGIVCNHVYEHVPQADRLMDEIYRVLRKEGFCYFSAGNKYMIMEGHYDLPFLSWLPKPLAHFYLKMTGKGNFYYEAHLSLWALKRLVKRFEIHDYTLSIIRDPERFHAMDLFPEKSLFYQCIRFMAPYLYPLIPTYVWVLAKR